MRALSSTEIRFFRLSGFLVLPWTFSGDLMDRAVEYLDAMVKQDQGPLRRDPQGTIVKLYDLFCRHDLFREIYTSDLVLSPLESLLGPDIEFLLHRHNHASVIVRAANEYRFHRDVLHWSRPTVSALVYPQATNVENGCTWFIPCSQHSEFVPPSDSPLHGGTWLDECAGLSELENQAFPVAMEKGGILLFDSLAFHSPGVNVTPNARYALTAAYHASDELTREHDGERVLVRGRRMYRGNDLHWRS